MDWDTAFKRATAMHPNEVRNLTFGAVDPVGSIKLDAEQTARQIAEDAKQAAKKAAKGLWDTYRNVQSLKIKWGLGLLLSPDALMKEMEREEREKNKLKMFT
jgi:hypothetical protein